MASSAYAVALVDVLDVTQLALDLTAAGNKVALFTNTLTPNFLTDSGFASAPYNANQVTSANYTAGGLVIASPTWVAAGAAPVITYDLADSAWNPVTFTARRAIYYADGLAGKNVYYCLDFGSDFTATTGPFTIVYDVLGLFTWTL